MKKKSLLELFNLLEYSDKVINTMLAVYKSQTDLSDSDIKQYITRFDQLKNKLKQGFDKKDINITRLIPQDLAQGNKYLDILQWRDFNALKHAIEKLSQKAVDPYAQMIKFFSQDRNLEEPVIKFYIARFKKINRELIDKVEVEKDPDIIGLIPKQLLHDKTYQSILNWRNFHQLETLLDAGFPPDSSEQAELNQAIADGEKIYDKNGIEIYQGNSQQRCVKYGHGLGNSYSWCISRTDPSNMYSNYRFMGNESRMFYFVFDRSRSSVKAGGGFEDTYHAIVIHVYENGGYGFTHASNAGDRFARDWNELGTFMPKELWAKIKDLKPLFKYIPPSREEKELAALKGKKLTLEQFIDLSEETKKIYIDGGNKLTPEQIESLSTELKNQYINVGQVMPFEIVSQNMPLIKRYIKIHFERKEKPVDGRYLEYMTPQQKQQYFNKYKDEAFLDHEMIEKYFPDFLPEYIQSFLDMKFQLPEHFIEYMNPQQAREFSLYIPAFKDGKIESEVTDDENLIPNFYFTPVTLSKIHFTEMDPKERIPFIQYIKKLIESEELEQYFSLKASLPKYKITNGVLFFGWDNSGNNPGDNWINAENPTVRETNWDKYIFMKRAGLIK
jgi:hypothetical protein